MLRQILTAIVLLDVVNIAMAQSEPTGFAAIKVDLNQVAFEQLAVKGAAPNAKVVLKSPGGINNPGAKGDAVPLSATDGLWIYGFFELRRKPQEHTIGEKKDKGDGTTIRQFDYLRWGKDLTLYVPEAANVVYRSVKFRNSREEHAKRSTGNKTADDCLRTVNWDLTHGMPRAAAETVTSSAKRFPERPAFANYLQVKAAMKKVPTLEDSLLSKLITELKAEDYKSIDSPEGHYRMYYRPDVDKLPIESLKWRLSRMEDTFNNFYCWFALQEKVAQPPLPDHKLTVILENTLDYAKRLKEHGITSRRGDGNLLKQLNVVVLTTEPTGDQYRYLEKNNDQARINLNLKKTELIGAGVSPLKSIWQHRKDVMANLPNVAMLQTLTILEKIMEDEALTRAIQQECIRQLLGSTGLVSRNVAAPEWVQHGLVSYFETPPQTSLYGAGFGSPRGEYLTTLKNVTRNFKGNAAKESADVLLNVVSDNYFRQANADYKEFHKPAKKDADPKERRARFRRAKDSEELAEAASWALVYYLAVQRKSENLARYAEQINRLPRHAIITADAFQKIFARAFDLADAKDPNQIDHKKLQAFAENWLAHMTQSVREEVVELESFREALPPAPTK